MAADIDRATAERLDATDPLAEFRDEFVSADPDLIYLDGNSLGRLPRATPAFVQSVVGQGWGEGLVRSWPKWIDWGARLGDRLAEHVLGARPGEVVVADSTSVNLYKLASAAIELQAGRGREVIVYDPDDFPTDRYILQGLANAHGMTLRPAPSRMDGALSVDDLESLLDEDVALVALSLVSYRSGALLDLAAVNASAARVGAVVLWDLCHAAGAVPVDLTGSGSALAVGCTYKYLNGGPGSPAFLYVRQDLQPLLRQPIWGWFGQRDQFQMGDAYDPVDELDRFLVGTPPLLSLAAIDPALTIVERAGVAAIRAKGIGLGELAVALADTRLTELGFRLASPRAADRRGSHVCLEHPDAWRICRAAAEQAGVICDYRVPDRLRIGLSPLYTRYVDVWDAVDRIHDVVARGAHEWVPTALTRVT